MKLIEALRLAQEIKARESRHKTILVYSSFLNRFIQYWTELGNKDSLLVDFKKKDAVQYLDYVLLKKKVVAITRNNYLQAMRLLFYVLVDREYIDKNPFAGLKKLKATQKRRKVFSKAERSIICNFLKGKNDELLLAISLCYYCALRPAEIRRLKIGDINLRDGIITLDGEQTKNKDLATITMPNHLVEFMEEIRLKRYPAEYYVFSGPSLKAGLKQCATNRISTVHKEVIEQLAMYDMIIDTEGKTFYSWKDTAARDMIEEGINAAALMKHFRHKSLETTQRYLESFGTTNEQIKELKSKLF